MYLCMSVYMYIYIYICMYVFRCLGSPSLGSNGLYEENALNAEAGAAWEVAASRKDPRGALAPGFGEMGAKKGNPMEVPRPPNVPLLRALWYLLLGIWGILKGSWGVLVQGTYSRLQSWNMDVG